MMPLSFSDVRAALRSRDRAGLIRRLGEILEQPECRSIIDRTGDQVKSACEHYLQAVASGDGLEVVAVDMGPWALRLTQDLWEFIRRGSVVPKGGFSLIAVENFGWVRLLLRVMFGEGNRGEAFLPLFSLPPPFEMPDGSDTAATDDYMDLFEALWSYSERELRARLPLESELLADGRTRRTAQVRAGLHDPAGPASQPIQPLPYAPIGAGTACPVPEPFHNAVPKDPPPETMGRKESQSPSMAGPGARHPAVPIGGGREERDLRIRPTTFEAQLEPLEGGRAGHRATLSTTSSTPEMAAVGSEQHLLPTITRRKAYGQFPELKCLAGSAASFVDKCDRSRPGQMLYLFKRGEFKGPNGHTYRHVVQAMAKVARICQSAAEQATVVDEDAVIEVLEDLGLPVLEGRRIIDSLQDPRCPDRPRKQHDPAASGRERLHSTPRGSGPGNPRGKGAS